MMLGIGVEELGDRAILEDRLDGAGEQWRDGKDGKSVPTLGFVNRHGVGEDDLAGTAVLEAVDRWIGKHTVRGDDGDGLRAGLLQHIAGADDGAAGID